MTAALRIRGRAQGVAAVVAAVFAVLTMTAVFAADTPTIAGGDCWRAGTPLWCRNNWVTRNTYVDFRAIDHFTDQRPGWFGAASDAVSAWNSAPGPQLYTFSERPNQTWNFFEDSYTGYNGLRTGEWALTYNCREDWYCSPSAVPMMVRWSSIYFNKQYLDGASYTTLRRAFAHESGHAMGLAHNVGSSAALMYPNTSSTVVTPTFEDIGRYPGCSGGGAGVNCVYGWGVGY